MLWNVHGLQAALHLLETGSNQHDLLILTETWTSPDIQAADIPGYTCFSSSKNFKHALAWKASGGVACYVKDTIASRCELWRIPSPGSILWLRSEEKFTWVSRDFHLHIGLVYISPHGSSSEKHITVSSYEMLQQDLPEHQMTSTLVHLESLCWICVRCLTYAS